MKAIILAAGVGKRLGAAADGLPKCLIHIGGKSLLARHLENFTSLGIRQVTIVVGYEQETIRQTVDALDFPGTVHFVVNPQYTRGSITSFWEVRHAIDDDVVIMDADVLYHPAILRRLVESSYPNALLVDETVTQETEECMVAIQGNRVIKLSKQLPPAYDFAGEGVGFLKVSKSCKDTLVGSIHRSILAERLDSEYEDGLQDFFNNVQVGFERIGGLPWVEIDFPADVQRAEQEVLPEILGVGSIPALQPKSKSKSKNDEQDSVEQPIEVS